eukprot:scaffold64915_cov45-Attheya_sp.AAC.3
MVFAQHQRYFNSIISTPAELEYLSRHGILSGAAAETVVLHTRGLIPTAHFLYDLKADIESWQEKGDQLIVMGDFNADIRGDLLRIVLRTSPCKRSPPPIMIQQRHHRLSMPDPSLLMVSGLRYGFGGDHRVAWTEFSFSNAFDHAPP